MISEEEFLKAELEKLNLSMANPAFVALAEEVSRYVQKLNPESIIDYGCGTGVYSEVIRRNGFNIVAQDVFKSHREYCKENYHDLKVVARPVKAQLMLFIEVAEHMTDSEIGKALKAIDPEFILFSSTPETTELDDLWGHCNIKQEPEWIEFMLDHGYRVIDRPKTPTQWALMFKRI